jgi:adenine-specific DNA-methyltransferase
MIKYLGSKRLLAPVIGDVAEAIGARTAVDLFTGTTRVAQELKRRGLFVTAVDIATYSEVLAACYIAADARSVDEARLRDEIGRLNAIEGRRGYVTETFCEKARYFQSHNGARIDAIRDELEGRRDDPLFPMLLTSLLLAADRVDSTTGVQMAYLKQWAPRAHQELQLRCPDLLSGPGRAVRGDARASVEELDHVDLVYLDPPYNQHRYFTNYHVWETLVRWDAPAHYGVACKRVDARDEATKSVFNVKRRMPDAFVDLLGRVRADVVVVSYNDESWLSPDAIVTGLLEAGHDAVELVAFDSRRYIGAQIGIFNPAGEKVGAVSRLRNVEYLFLAGPADHVATATAAALAGGGRPGRAATPV